MLDKQLHELIMQLGDSRNNNSSSDNNIEPVEFKIWERDSNGLLASKPVRSVQNLDSNSNSKIGNSNVKEEQEPIITELGSKAGSSVPSPNQSNNVNKAKIIHDFIISNGRF